MWDVLAIAPTDDPKVIRRAYAARLRQIDPDRDRAGFARLRQALEWALAVARQPPLRVPPPEPARDPAPADDGASMAAIEIVPVLQDRADAPVSTAHQPPALLQRPAPPASVAVEERAGERALLIDLESALQRRDARDASQLYCRAAATGALPFGDTERMLARLFTVALDDPTFHGEAFRGLVKSFGWDRPELDSAAVSAVRQRVAARLAAEDWYDGLVANAERKWRIPRKQARAARLMLKRIRGRGLLLIDRPSLRIYLDELKRHDAWLRDRIPPDWVALLEKRLRRREIIASALLTMFVGSFLLQGIVVVIAAMFKEGLALTTLPLVGLAAFLIWVLKHLVKSFVGVWRGRPA